MKRTCLLSRAYTGAPMLLAGREIIYSAIANEIIREFDSAFFNGAGAGDQTDFGGMCEGLLVMWHLAENDLAAIQQLRAMDRPARARTVLDFSLLHEAEIDRIKDQLLDRIESAAAAAVESEARGKSHPPAQDSSR